MDDGGVTAPPGRMGRGADEFWQRTGAMPRQQVDYNGHTYGFSGDFAERLRRFQRESGQSWAEFSRRLACRPRNGAPLEGQGRAAQHTALQRS